MLPSEKLRKLISKTYNLELEKYAWSEELKNFILSIKLDEIYEDKVSSMQEVYEKGLNIGHCGLTGRYLSRNIEKAKLHYGTCSLLKGTKNSPDGDHAWITINNFLIDTTLMLNIPLEYIHDFGYIEEKMIAKDSSCMLSEYDTYSNEIIHLVKNKEEFNNEIFKISK